MSLHFRGMLSWNLNLTRSFIIWLCSSLFQHPLLVGSTFLHASYSCLFIWVFNVSAEKVTKVHQLKEDLHNIYVPDESFMKGHFYEGSYHWKDEQFCCIWWSPKLGNPETKLVDELSLEYFLADFSFHQRSIPPLLHSNQQSLHLPSFHILFEFSRQKYTTKKTAIYSGFDQWCRLRTRSVHRFQGVQLAQFPVHLPTPSQGRITLRWGWLHPQQLVDVHLTWHWLHHHPFPLYTHPWGTQDGLGQWIPGQWLPGGWIIGVGFPPLPHPPPLPPEQSPTLTCWAESIASWPKDPYPSVVIFWPKPMKIQM